MADIKQLSQAVVNKIAAQLKARGTEPLLGAADTFRATAIDQLAIWAERLDCDIVRHQDGADPSFGEYVLIFLSQKPQGIAQYEIFFEHDEIPFFQVNDFSRRFRFVFFGPGTLCLDTRTF